MIEPEKCLHLVVQRLADNSSTNVLHGGQPGIAYFCHKCGSTFFLELKPAEIKVDYGRPK